MNTWLAFSKHRSAELKIIIIDNAGFHSLTKYKIPQNIKLIRIPPYSPELNPSEKYGLTSNNITKIECLKI